MDAFTISWKDLHPYLFPPFTIIPRILSKIKTDTVDKAIIIVPLWPSQLWFPLLISLIVSCQITTTQTFNIDRTTTSANQENIDRTTTSANQENRFCCSAVIRQSLIDKGVSIEDSAFITIKNCLWRPCLLRDRD